MDEGEKNCGYFQRGIAEVCRRFRGRSAGSAAETGCQHYFAKELHQWADQVEVESFSVHPKAFMGWVTADGILSLVAVALYWGQLAHRDVALSVVALFLTAAALALFVFEFLLYRQFVDFLFPRAVSHNVYATRNPHGPCRQRIIFGGHADAAYEMTYSHHGGKALIYTVMVGALMGVVVCLGCSGALLVRLLAFSAPLGWIWPFLGWLQLTFAPFFVASLFFINWNQVVDGANDNLSACFASMGVLRRMSDGGQRLRSTQVCCLITGAEESGLRGALAFSKGHRQTLEEIPTVFVALDTLRETGQLMIYLSGQSGTQKNDTRVGRLIQQAAATRGLCLKAAPLYPGATDAEGFSRNGFAACGLCGVDHNPQPYYHTRADTWDNIDEGCIETVLEICLEAARIFDEAGGLDSFS